MTAVELLTELRTRGAMVTAMGDRLRIEAPQGSIGPDLVTELSAHKAELLAALSAPEQPATFDPDGGQPAAVWLRDTVVGDVWLVADTEALADHPDIIRSGWPVFFFDEIERLDIEAAALRLATSVDWLYRHSKDLPFVVRNGRQLRFSAHGIDRYIRERSGA